MYVIIKSITSIIFNKFSGFHNKKFPILIVKINYFTNIDYFHFHFEVLIKYLASIITITITINITINITLTITITNTITITKTITITIINYQNLWHSY